MLHKKTLKVSISLILSFFSITLFYKFIELLILQNSKIDGDGIGINYLFFEINDTVFTKDIYLYTQQFLILTIIFLSITIIAIYFFFFKK